jgi:hypothetical protein
MKFVILLFLSSSLIVACSSKDEKFCQCMEVSEKFNVVANKIIQKGADKTLETEFKKLKVKKEKACEKFLTMGGKEMLEKKAACQN